MKAYWPLKVVEILVLGGIVAAFVLPLFTSGGEEESRQSSAEWVGHPLYEQPKTIAV